MQGERNPHYWKDSVRDAHSPRSHIPRGVLVLAALYRGYRVRKMQGIPDAWIEEREEVPIRVQRAEGFLPS